jgi:hypothetical protein
MNSQNSSHANMWGNITKFFVIFYVTIGGGYELYGGYRTHHIHSSFIFAFLSGTIFIGRIGYGITSGAKKTIPADIYGLAMMWTVAFVRLYLDGF